MSSDLSSTETSMIGEVHTLARPQWRNKFEYAFNMLGLTIGLGNVWRFSYLCFKSGGGSFLVPYLLTAVLVGVPLVFLESAIAQFTQHGCIACWNILPLMRGMGFAQVMIVIYFLIYFLYLVGWCIFYMLKSVSIGPLPWTTCDNWWNSNSCIPIQTTSVTAANETVNSLSAINGSGVPATAEFWNDYVLQRTSGIEDLGEFNNWKMLGCYVAAWVTCFLCIYKGIRTSGKAAYITVITPYILMFALFIRSITLEGAGQGALYYVTPNITRLADPTVWLDAGGQIIYSLGICSGSIHALASYNKRSYDCFKGACYIVGLCCGSSLFFGLVVFCFMGHMATIQGTHISNVLEGGPGLVFEVFPTEFSYLPASQVWAFAFFACLTMLAIDGAFCAVEGVITAFADYWPEYFGHRNTFKWRVGLCLVLLLLGLPHLADGGIYIFELLNMYGTSGVTFLLAATLEVIIVAWVYGIDRFYDDVKSMIGYYPPKVMMYCLKFATPGICLVIFIAWCTQYSPLKLGSYVYPGWAYVIGWMMTLSVIICIPLGAVLTLLRAPGSWRQKWIKSTTSMIGTSEEKENKDVFMEQSM